MRRGGQEVWFSERSATSALIAQPPIWKTAGCITVAAGAADVTPQSGVKAMLWLK